MNDSGFYVPQDKASRLSRFYNPGQDGKLTSQENGPFLEKPGFFSGGGGLTSTASDYLRFARMHLNGGELDGVRILSPEAANLMRSNQLPEGIKGLVGFAPGQDFGLDFAIITNPATNNGMSAGSYHWWGLAGTWFWIDPVENLIFIGMLQNSSVGYFRQVHAKSKDLLYKPL